MLWNLLEIVLKVKRGVGELRDYFLVLWVFFFKRLRVGYIEELRGIFFIFLFKKIW